MNTAHLAGYELEHLVRVDPLTFLPKDQNTAIQTTPDGAVDITTPSVAWAYAAFLSLAPTLTALRSRVLVRAVLSVSQGAVGISLERNNQQLFLEQVCKPHADRHTIDFDIEIPGDVKELVLRSVENSVAIVRVHEVSIYRVLRGPSSSGAFELRPVASVDLIAAPIASPPGAVARPRTDGSFEVITPSDQWEYGARIPIRALLSQVQSNVLIHIECYVRKGEIGFGIGTDDGFLTEEIIRSPRNGRTTVAFESRDFSRWEELVIRNTGATSSAVIIESITFYEIEVDSTRLIRSLDEDYSPLTYEPDTVDGSIPALTVNESPLVSIIITVKNGMPFLAEALQSMEKQTYRKFELVVQDCMSSDGSSELIQAQNFPCSYVRESDSGIGDANNRALARCSGSIVGSIDSDNVLMPSALELAVNHFVRNPTTGAVYGSVQMIAADGAHQSFFAPAEFDFVRVATCELVPPWSTAFFSRAVCGTRLKFDSSLKTCVDFDIWLRLSDLTIDRLESVVGATRLSEESMTCRPETYEQFCVDKIFALRRYLYKNARPHVAKSILLKGVAGIYLWAAESILRLDPSQKELAVSFLDRAASTGRGDTARMERIRSSYE